MRPATLAVVLTWLSLSVSIGAQRGSPQQPCEPAGAPAQKPAADLIASAKCYDDHWAFAEAERVLASAIAAVESQMAAAPDEIISGGPMFVGRDIVTPKATNNPVGDYPAAAAARGIAGTVVVAVALKADGSVSHAEVVDSVPDLDAAALASVKKMKFERTLVAGKPVEVSFFVPARFGLAAESTPADWMVLAGSYLTHGHPAAAAQTLGRTLDMERRDAKRFGPSILRGGTSAPRRTNYVAPKYPPVALAAKTSGMVILEALIDPTGQVGRARVVRSVPGFDGAALDALLQWTFEPAMFEGKPVSIVLTTTVTFNVK